VTRFGRGEIVNSVYLAVHHRYIDDRVARAAIADLEGDLREGRLAIVDVAWRRALDLAIELSVRYTATLGTRTLDILHVASALTLEAKRFVSYEKGQGTLARAVGLRVLAP
jgi:hypothetical protein